MVTVQGRSFLQTEEYHAAEWARSLSLVPKTRVVLGHVPTPLHRWNVQNLPSAPTRHLQSAKAGAFNAMCDVIRSRCNVCMAGAGGHRDEVNVLRRLLSCGACIPEAMCHDAKEFLIAEALAQGADTIITLGGIQSNHARATAVAATMLGLECHLILRNSRTLVDGDPGLVGNLLVERMAGAHVHQVSKEEYARVGQQGLATILQQQLRAQGKKPYVIPVGGSNALGTWGYLDCIQEVQAQTGRTDAFTDIVMACGSGATSGGLALGAHLSGSGARVTAYAVCDSPKYFFDFISDLFDGLGATPELLGGDVSSILRVMDVKGAGYAISKDDELATIQQVALQTGVILDPVYTGKAVHGLLRDMASCPEEWEGRRVLFVHTGGLFGMYDKLDQLQPLAEGLGRSHRLQIPEGTSSQQKAKVEGGAMV